MKAYAILTALAIISIVLVSGCEILTNISTGGQAITLPCDETVKCSTIMNDNGEANFCRDNGDGWTWSRCAECGNANLCSDNGYYSEKYASGATSRCVDIMYICTDMSTWDVCSANNVGKEVTSDGQTYICVDKTKAVKLTDTSNYYKWVSK